MKVATLLKAALCLTAGTAVGLFLGMSITLQHQYHPQQQHISSSAITFSYSHKLRSAGDTLCNVLRPAIDAEALGLPSVLSKSHSARRGVGCREGVWYEMGREGLGHRLGNYAAGLALSLAWGLPPHIGPDDADRCGTHGCYSGMEDALGLARGLTRTTQLTAITRTRVKPWQHGTSLKAALGRLDGQGCVALWSLGQDVWLRDLSIARHSLRAQLLAREHSTTSPALPKLPFNRVNNTVIAAIHLRFGGSDFHKRTDESWLRHLLMEELVPLSTTIARVEWHVFTGMARFGWLSGIKGLVVHGGEVDPVTTFRSMTHADILICGHSSLCFHAALVLASQPLSLALLPSNTEPFPYDMCPDDLICVAGSGALTSEQRIRFSDTVSRAALSRSLHCQDH